MTVAQDDAVERPVERLAAVGDSATLALLVAAGFGLVGGVLVGVAAALAAGSAAAAVGMVAAVGFAVTTVAVFEAGKRIGDDR
ncbi:hypothetical protein BRC81_02020 [Halobacteriales archaeon QS_1_68_20]|nr:MAG: hypothetical protein BRC81_02020 [Halobacteriales archaeon QS_1_68_20]